MIKAILTDIEVKTKCPISFVKDVFLTRERHRAALAKSKTA